MLGYHMPPKFVIGFEVLLLCAIYSHLVFSPPAVLTLFSCALAMALWKMEDLLNEIQHLETLEKRPRGKNIFATMVNSLEEKLKSIPNLAPSAVVKLMDATDSSTLTAETKDKLLSVLDCCSGPASNVRLSATQQSIGNLGMYLTASDWGKLQNTNLTRDVFQTLVQRVKQIGMVSMKEDVKAQALGLTLHWMESKGMPLPDPWPLYYLGRDFSKLFMGMRVQCQVGSLASYPGNPMDLGEEWISKAYGTNEVPLCRDVPLSMYIDKIPLRSTSHLLKNVAQASNAKIAAVATPQQSIQLPVPEPVPWSMFFAFL